MRVLDRLEARALDEASLQVHASFLWTARSASFATFSSKVDMLSGRTETRFTPIVAMIVSLQESELERSITFSSPRTAICGFESHEGSVVRFARPPSDTREARRGEEMTLVPDVLEQELVAAGLARKEDLEHARDQAAVAGLSLWETLVERGAAEHELYQRVASAYGLPLAQVELLVQRIDEQVARSVSRRYQERKRLIPIRREDRVLTVVSCDPAPRVVDLADALDADRVELQFVTPTDFRRLRWAIDLGQLAGPGAARERARAADLLKHDVRAESRHAALLDAIVADAAGERASDVHLERYQERIRLRLRVDGDLHDVDHYGLMPSDYLGIVNVLKVRAGLDIAERRLPQGGRFSERIGGRKFDLRVQTSPTIHGEVAQARLLPQDRSLFSMSALGFSDALVRRYRQALRSPSGLLLVVGPTGCGKSTTLYAGLQELAANASRKVVTIEDPVEYVIENVHQTQAHPEIGYAFADAVRSFVRHDPDVIFVGEIRDTETAREALRASQTGHLVLSTLHANDAVDAVQRLYDLGMHPNSIAAELLAVFSQRLMKRVCPACRGPEEPEAELLQLVFPKGAPDGFRSMRGAGCERCHGRGSFGRVAVAEHLNTNRDVRLAVSRQLPLDELRGVAAAAGLRPLREHAFELMRDGIISFNELPAVFPLERLAGARS